MCCFICRPFVYVFVSFCFFLGKGFAGFCVYSCLCDFGRRYLLYCQLLSGPGNILGHGGFFSDDLEHFHISLLAADRRTLKRLYVR